MSEPYLLSPHVHVCVAGKHVVLLDLEHDKYLAVVPPHRLAPWVKGWPVKPAMSAATGPNEPPPAPAQDTLLEKMLEQDMLVTDPSIGKEATPVATTRADSTIVAFDFNSKPHVSFKSLVRMAGAYAAAKSALTFQSIKSVVTGAFNRKRRQAARHAGGSFDLLHMRRLMDDFIYLRPLFFTAHGACLLDSLTLVNYLAAESIYPDWIFGVKTEPFYAHCWVQFGSAVFNDTPDHVRGFSPILVV